MIINFKKYTKHITILKFKANNSTQNKNDTIKFKNLNNYKRNVQIQCIKS